MSEDDGIWKPHPGPQTAALASPAYELMYGGAAGGGKSDFLLAGAFNYIHQPSFSGIFFRRTSPELEDAIVRARELFEPFGGLFNQNDGVFRFPDQDGKPGKGARFYLSHLQHDTDAFKHRGRAYQYLAFDELTTFSLFQYRYLMSRTRSAQGLPIEVRSATNPEPGWVKDRWAPWVDESWQGPRPKPGELLWYKARDGVERYVRHGTRGAQSRTFMPAMLVDNPSLGQDYAERLAATQDAVQTARLLGGSWSADYTPGLLFRRSMFTIVPAVPERAIRVRAWDLAATEEKLVGSSALKPGHPNDPDYTVGMLYGWAPNFGFFIEGIERVRGRPEVTRATIERIAKQDAQRYGQHGVTIAIPQDPGAAGKMVFQSFASMLARYRVVMRRPDRNKVRRAGPASSTAEHAGIRMLAGPWNEAFLQEAEQFPKGPHDDQIDTLSDGHETIGEIRAVMQATNDYANLPDMT